jgi:hypothetical protein
MEDGVRVRFPTPNHVRVFAFVLSSLSRCQTAYSVQRHEESSISESLCSEGIRFSAEATRLTLSIKTIGCSAAVSFRNDFFSRECGGRLDVPSDRALLIAVEPVYWWPVVRPAAGASGAAGIGRKTVAITALNTASAIPTAPTTSGVPVEQLEVRADPTTGEVVLDAVASTNSLVAVKARGPAGFHDPRHWRFQYRFRALMYYQEPVENEFSTSDSYSCRMRFAPRIFLDALSNMHRQTAQVTFHFEQLQLHLSSAQIIRNGSAVVRYPSRCRDRPRARPTSLHTQVKIEACDLDIYEGFADVFGSSYEGQHVDEGQRNAEIHGLDPALACAMTVPVRPFKAWLELGLRLGSAVWMLHEPGGALLLRLDMAHLRGMATSVDETVLSDVISAKPWTVFGSDNVESEQPWLSAEMQLPLRRDMSGGNNALSFDRDSTWLIAQDERRAISTAASQPIHGVVPGSSQIVTYAPSHVLEGVAAASPLPGDLLGASRRPAFSATPTAAQVLLDHDQRDLDSETSSQHVDSVGGTPPPMTMMPGRP